MRIIEGTTEFQVQEETAISIGKFDGLHQGHQLLVERIVKKKQEGLKALIFTFDFGDRPVLLLPEERREMLRKWGVDYLLECPFVESISHMEAEEFVRKILVERLHVRYLAVGTDFRFGCQRRGDYRLLQRLSAECGYEVEVVEKACCQCPVHIRSVAHGESACGVHDTQGVVVPVLVQIFFHLSAHNIDIFIHDTHFLEKTIFLSYQSMRCRADFCRYSPSLPRA